MVDRCGLGDGDPSPCGRLIWSRQMAPGYRSYYRARHWRASFDVAPNGEFDV